MSTLSPFPTKYRRATKPRTFSFASRRRFWRTYLFVRSVFDKANYSFWEGALKYKPKPHGTLGLAVLLFYTECAICFGARLFALGFLSAAAAFALVIQRRSRRGTRR